MLLLLTLALGAAPVSLQLRAVQREIAIGEPLRLELRWETRERVTLPMPPGLGEPAEVEVSIAQSPGEPRDYRESGRGARKATSGRAPLPARRTEYWDVILHHGLYAPFDPGPPALAFP